MANRDDVSRVVRASYLTAMLLLGVSLNACGGAPYYKAAPIEAWVVDADTGQPIEGAVVTANWELVRGGLDGPRYYGQLEVKETVTDKSGRFQFDGFTKANPGLAELRNHDPKILILKAGYRLAMIVNKYPEAGTRTPGINRVAQVDGDKIKLARFAGDIKVIERDSMIVDTQVGFVLEDPKECLWSRVPLMIRELVRQELFIKQHGGGRKTSIAWRLRQNNDYYLSKARAGCPAPNSYNFFEIQK